MDKKQVLLEKVDTPKNVVDSLMKYVSDEKFIWCIETMGLLVLVNLTGKGSLSLVYAKKIASGRMLGMLCSLQLSMVKSKVDWYTCRGSTVHLMIDGNQSTRSNVNGKDIDWYLCMLSLVKLMVDGKQVDHLGRW